MTSDETKTTTDDTFRKLCGVAAQLRALAGGSAALEVFAKVLAATATAEFQSTAMAAAYLRQVADHVEQVTPPPAQTMH